VRKRRYFTPEFKAQVLREVIAGEKSAAEVGQEHGLKPDMLSHWKATLVERASLAFQSREQRSQEQAQIAELERQVSRQDRELEILKKGFQRALPRKQKQEVARQLAQEYPVQVVCKALGIPRSSFYYRRKHPRKGTQKP
jgi:putative transposase